MPALRERERERERPAVAMCLNGGGMRRIDAESETLITCPLTGNPYGDHESRETLLVAHTLRGDGFDASEDGTGRGTPIDPMYTLQSGHQHAVGFQSKASSSQSMNPSDISPSLDVGKSDGVAVAFRAAGQDGFTPRDQSPPLTSTDGGGTVPTVAFNLRGREGGAMAEMASIRSASGGSSRTYVGTMAVRRLLPVECERLQGFPDNWTAIAFRKKPAADGPRYKSLGNSMAVPVLRLILTRIQQVEEIAKTLRLQGDE